MPLELPKPCSLAQLRRAVGPWPWRVQWITDSSGKPISETTTLMLSLVVFGGYELFPGPTRGKAKKAK